jgi:hypothetical protein
MRYEIERHCVARGDPFRPSIGLGIANWPPLVTLIVMACSVIQRREQPSHNATHTTANPKIASNLPTPHNAAQETTKCQPTT